MTRLVECGFKSLHMVVETFHGSQQVSRQIESEKSIACNRECTSALIPRADVTRSPEQGHHRTHKKDVCPPKVKNKITLVFQMLIKLLWP